MKCNMNLCKSKASIIGQCTKCNRSFCNSHRLFEEHQCSFLDIIKENGKQKLQDSIQNLPKPQKLPTF
jgi:predicted nucleic acid binding AN1-type Zn finger protein